MKTRARYIKLSLFLLIAICTVTRASAQEITMFPGFWGYSYYQDNIQIGQHRVGLLMANDPVTYKLWQKSKVQATLGYVAVGIEMVALTWWSSSYSPYQDNTAPLVITLVTAGIATGLLVSSNNLKKKAILRYNHNLQDSVTLEITPTRNGVGLVVRF